MLFPSRGTCSPPAMRAPHALTLTTIIPHPSAVRPPLTFGAFHVVSPRTMRASGCSTEPKCAMTAARAARLCEVGASRNASTCWSSPVAPPTANSWGRRCPASSVRAMLVPSMHQCLPAMHAVSMRSTPLHDSSRCRARSAGGVSARVSGLLGSVESFTLSSSWRLRTNQSRQLCSAGPHAHGAPITYQERCYVPGMAVMENALTSNRRWLRRPLPHLLARPSAWPTRAVVARCAAGSVAPPTEPPLGRGCPAGA